MKFFNATIELNFLSSHTVSCTVSLVQLTVQCCIQTVCCGFQFALQFVTFNLLLQYVCHSVDCQLHYNTTRPPHSDVQKHFLHSSSRPQFATQRNLPLCS